MSQSRSSTPSLRDWGVVQDLRIAADTETALRAACEIMFTEHSKGADSYAVKDGVLLLFWCDADGTKLPFVLDTAKKVFEFVSNWLDQAERGPETDTDGSVKAGFRIENGHGYIFMRVKPEWIVYGK